MSGAKRYSIPRGGLFDYASSAQYFCELWAWAGFALLSAGPNGAFIFLVSLGNLVPRAMRPCVWDCRRTCTHKQAHQTHAY